MGEAILIRQAVGHALHLERKEQKLTLRELSDFASVALGHISEVERGIKEPSSETLDTICSALALDTDELLRRAATHLLRAELTRAA